MNLEGMCTADDLDKRLKTLWSAIHGVKGSPWNDMKYDKYSLYVNYLKVHGKEWYWFEIGGCCVDNAVIMPREDYERFRGILPDPLGTDLLGEWAVCERHFA